MLMKNRSAVFVLVTTLAVLALKFGPALSADAAPVTREEFELLKKQMTSVQDENSALRSKIEPLADPLAQGIDNKYGPEAVVTTHNGKLTFNGLIQIWYYHIQNDSRGLFDNRQVTNIADFNTVNSDDSFRIRRAELRFSLDISEHISAYMMMDGAREATSFPFFPDNQGQFKRTPNSLTGSAVTGVQTGVGAAPRLLQDAYITYRDVVPHHDFQVGQYKPLNGDEAMRFSYEIDFIERSYVGQLFENRDLGAHIRGHWFDDRLQYWVGMFDAAGNYFQSAGQQQNRSDDNDNKDTVLRIVGRPLWKNDCWGSLELGASVQFGKHGQSGTNDVDPFDRPVGINRPTTFASRTDAFGSYFAGGVLKGFWTRGEWASIHDRNATGTVIDLLNQDINGDGLQDTVRPFTMITWSASTGYKLGQGPCAQCLPKFSRNLELAFRYEYFQNVQVANQVNPGLTDQFATRVYTTGINYYIQGNNAKIQLNYNHLQNPDNEKIGGVPVFHQVRNDSLILGFQVYF